MAHKRWTAVDTETGEILTFSSRAFMRAAIRASRGTLKAREPEIIEGPPAPRARPLWASQHWVADTVSMKRERAFDNATAGMRFAFLKAVTSRDAEAATRIRNAWEQNVKAYAEGRMEGNDYSAAMKEVTGWLYTTPYAPPVAIWYHEGTNDDDDYVPEEYPDWYDEEYG